MGACVENGEELADKENSKRAQPLKKKINK